MEFSEAVSMYDCDARVSAGRSILTDLFLVSNESFKVADTLSGLAYKADKVDVGVAFLSSPEPLSAMLVLGDDTQRWSPALAAEITGFVVDVKPNCKLPRHRCCPHRPHIEIVPDSNDSLPTRRVIVEVTPRGRAVMAAKNPPVNWSTANLRRILVGKRIRVQGWMMFDAQHWNAAENTAPGHNGNWRATAWETVTGMQSTQLPTE